MEKIIMKNWKTKAGGILLSSALLLQQVPWSVLPVHAQEAASETQVQEEVNVALQGTAWADSIHGGSWPASNLNDGNDSTLWIAGTAEPPVSCGITLDKQYDVSRVGIVFEHRNNIEEHLHFTAYYLNPETAKYVMFWQGNNYNPETETFASEIVLDVPVSTWEIKVTIDERENTQAWPAIEELKIYADPSTGTDYVRPDRHNLALNKTVTPSAGTGAEVITDGSTSGFWDGGPAPAEFEIDLGRGCFVDSFKGITYYGDGRYYQYEIWGSLDGRSYSKLAEKKDTVTATASGDVFELEEEANIRYVRVVMTKNSANPSVHMREFEVWGTEDPDYVEPEIPDEDLDDPDNIAFGKPVKSNLNTAQAAKITDGSVYTSWTGKFYPAVTDIDLMEEYDLEDVVVYLPVRENRYYNYTIYGSNDYANFDRLYSKRDENTVTEEGDRIDLSGHRYRFIRVSMEYCSDAGSSMISEVRVHGKAAGTNTDELRTGSIEEILSVQDFENTEYAREITPAETIENVYGIVERTVGEQYRSWFTFELAENDLNDNDYFELDMQDGKVRITGNDGVSLASGLNFYYKNYAHVNISEQANQVKMPEQIVSVDVPVRRETPYKVRYAMNYCTLDYTFAFFNQEAWQKENDWLALNGVNVVLDLAGQEAVWINFLMNFGYSYDEAKNWIAGPSYYAWQFMDNMEIFGGPVSDGWVKDRLEMGRSTQRWKRSLGMETVLQGYAGMIPTNFSEYKDVDILKQGGWCGLDRPDMIRTDGALYDEYAEKFYEAQRWAFGETSNYYAADPFHEGGIRPSDLSDSTIAAEVLDSLLKYDQDAVWMVQAWWSNPTNALLQGMGEYRQDHVMILDLTGLEAPKWNTTTYGSTTLDSVEFNGTDWVWCILKNYGGNTSMDGSLKAISESIPNALKNSEHMKGIGIISEATYDNPAVYDLVYDMAWTEEPVDVGEWVDSYIHRRYGEKSESARRAWDYLLKSIYNRTGNSGQIFASNPLAAGKRGVSMNKEYPQKALALLLEDFDLLCDSEAYLYDLTELMRQHVSNYAILVHGEMVDAQNAGNLELFREKKAEFLAAFDLCDEIAATQKDSMVGEWIGKADDWSANYDDFSEDMLALNAKALITSWAGSASAASLPDYAYRHYSGVLTDLYKARWSLYLDHVENQMQGIEDDFRFRPFDFYWKWILNTPEYSRTPDNSPSHMKELAQRVLTVADVAKPVPDLPENEGNLCLGKEVTASKEVNSGGSAGGYGEYITDGDPATYWDGGDWANRPEAIVDLSQDYLIDRINVVNYVASRSYQFEVYYSVNGTDWTLAAEKKDSAQSTAAGWTAELENPVQARYLKIVGTHNSQNEGFHVSEFRAYGEDLFLDLKDAIAQAEALSTEGKTPASAAALQEALKQARLLIRQTYSAETVQQAIAELQAASAALQNQANFTLLAMTVAEARTAVEEGALEGLNAIVADHFLTMLEEAETVLANENATQAEVNEAWLNLSSAFHLLDFRTDKTQLAALVAQCDALDLSEYKEVGKQEFLDALQYAHEVLDSDTALTEVSIQEATDRLQAALDGLQKKDLLDLSMLQWLTDYADALDLNLYISEGQEAFLAAREQAHAVLANAESQAQVDTALNSLHQTILDLRLKADEDLLMALQDLEVWFAALDLSLFAQADAASFQAMHEELTAALGNPQLSQEEGEVLLSRASARQAQARNLMNQNTDSDKKPAAPSLKPMEKPDSEMVSRPAGSTADPEQNVSAKQNVSSAQKQDASVSQSVKTASASHAGLAALGAALSSTLLYVLRRRRSH